MAVTVLSVQFIFPSATMEFFLVTLHYSTVRTAWFYGGFSSPKVHLSALEPTFMAPKWFGLFLYILVLTRFSSLSHEIAFDTHCHKPKPEHLIADIICDVLFYIIPLVNYCPQ